MIQSFVKYSAMGNDYIVVDPNVSGIQLTKQTIIDICNRNNGPGCDGILYGPLSKDNLSLRIFNPDGSECEKSGNGIRIFANYLYDRKYVNNRPFDIKLNDEAVSITPVNPLQGIFKVRMGAIKPGRLADPNFSYPYLGEIIRFYDEEFIGSFIDIGTRHMILETNAPTALMARKLGPLISKHPMFQDRSNVLFCKVINRNQITMQIYERGAGYTLSSGSSSCAAVAALYLQDKVDKSVSVNMPGGSLNIEIDDQSQIYLIGSTKLIYSGELNKNGI